jgi:hypothetical protein
VSPHEIKRGSEAPTLANPPRVGPNTLVNPQPTGVGKGVQGAQPPGGGRGGCPPFRPNPLAPFHAREGENLAGFSQRVGPQNAGKPSAHEGGQGGPGGTAPWRGAWGVSPHKTKRGSEAPTLANPPRVGPKTLANPQPTRVGKGVQGAQAPWQGVWGMCPQKPKEGASRPLLPTLPRVGPNTLANSKPTGVGKWEAYSSGMQL